MINNTVLTRDLIAQVHRLEIRTRRLVNEIFSGAYSSVFRGLGMEFAEVREYVPGDEVRSIDWNVTARMGHPYVKKFMAEREMTVVLAVDASASQRFGTAKRWKSELAAEVAAVLGFSAIRNNDKVGLMLFTDRVESFVPPRKGRTHTLRMIRDVLEFQPQGKGTNLSEALRYLNQVIKRKAVVFLLSDFVSPSPVRSMGEGRDEGALTPTLSQSPNVRQPGEGEWERLIAITHKRHDLIALQVIDPREQSMPNVGLVALEEAETGKALWLDTSDRAARDRFAAAARERQKRLDSLFRRHGIDHIPLQTGRSFVLPLVEFFHQRARRVR